MRFRHKLMVGDLMRDLATVINAKLVTKLVGAEVDAFTLRLAMEGFTPIIERELLELIEAMEDCPAYELENDAEEMDLDLSFDDLTV